MLNGTPPYLRELIANVFLAFMLKANVPKEEAIEMADKVKEKHMGQLFEHITINLNMEEARERVTKEVTEQVTQQDIRILVEACQELGASKETTVLQLMKRYALSREEAEAETARGWRE